MGPLTGVSCIGMSPIFLKIIWCRMGVLVWCCDILWSELGPNLANAFACSLPFILAWALYVGL